MIKEELNDTGFGVDDKSELSRSGDDLEDLSRILNSVLLDITNDKYGDIKISPKLDYKSVESNYGHSVISLKKSYNSYMQRVSLLYNSEKL